MKKVKYSLLFIAMLTLGFKTNVNAQEKLGYIDYEQLIRDMPETKTMENELKKTEQKYSDDIKKQEAQLKEKFEKYNAEAATQTDVTNRNRQEEVAQDEQRIKKYLLEAQKEIAQRQEELLAPIMEKANKAVEEVAIEKEIIYVFDKSTLRVARGVNVLPWVKSKLKIK